MDDSLLEHLKLRGSKETILHECSWNKKKKDRQRCLPWHLAYFYQ